MNKVIVQIDADLEDLIPGYMKNRHKDIQQMRAHIDTGNFDAIRRIGHSMKGSGGGYGFDRITEIGANLEDAALENDIEAITLAIKSLSEYIEQVEVVYS
jgi:HPt (histidine-containing phosphotransfer) domain-containing protein